MILLKLCYRYDIFNIEDMSSNGWTKLHFDRKIKVSDEDSEELFDTVLRTIEKGKEADN